MVVLDLGLESGEIESVGKVFLVNLAEVLVPSRRDELSPRDLLVNRARQSETEKERKTVNQANGAEHESMLVRSNLSQVQGKEVATDVSVEAANWPEVATEAAA